MTMCSGARLALLVYGIIMHSSVYCSPPAAGLRFPGVRPEDEAYDEDGNPLQDFYDSDPPGVGSPASALRDAYALYYPVETRDVAHAILNKAYRKLLDQLSARKYLQTLVAKGMGCRRNNHLPYKKMPPYTSEKPGFVEKSPLKETPTVSCAEVFTDFALDPMKAAKVGFQK